MQYFGVGFLILLFLEIMSIVWVADWLGGGFAFLLMIVSFIGGTMMLRHTGLSGILLAGATIRSGENVFHVSAAVADTLYRRCNFAVKSGLCVHHYRLAAAFAD